MKPKSSKAKGRRLQNKVVEILTKKFDKVLEEGDFKPAIMGESGMDVKLSPAAKKIFPWAVECKNQESISIWKCLKRAEDAADVEKLKPLLIFKRNRSETYVTLKLNDFLELLDAEERKST